MRPFTLSIGFVFAMAMGDTLATLASGGSPDLSWLGLSGATVMGTYFLLPVLVKGLTEIRAYRGKGAAENYKTFAMAASLSLLWLSYYPPAAMAAIIFWAGFWLVAWVLFPPKCLDYCVDKAHG